MRGQERSLLCDFHASVPRPVLELSMPSDSPTSPPSGERQHQTSLKFNGGDILCIDLSFDEVCKPLEQAMRHGKFMKIHGPDGYRIGINPQTVQFVQNGVERRIYSGPGETSSPGVVRV